MKTKKTSLFAFLLALNISLAQGQFLTDHAELFPKLKSGKLWIALGDPNAAVSKPYVDVIKKYWTFSNYEIIPLDDLNKHLNADDFYMTYNLYDELDGLSNEIDVWMCSADFFKKERKLKQKDMVILSRYYVVNGLSPEELKGMGLDFKGNAKNWGPGYLKNYLQLMQIYFAKNDNKRFVNEINNPDAYPKMKSETIYFPLYILVGGHILSGKDYKEEELFKKFVHKYQLVDKETMNRLIMDESKPVYYYSYVQRGTNKINIITDSKSGEIVYSSYIGGKCLLESDIKDILKKIDK